METKDISDEMVRGKLPRRMVWMFGLAFIAIIALAKVGLTYFQLKPDASSNHPSKAGEEAKKKAEEDTKFVGAMERDQVRQVLEKIEQQSGLFEENQHNEVPAKRMGAHGKSRLDQSDVTQLDLETSERQQLRERISIAPIFKSNTTRMRSLSFAAVSSSGSLENTWMKSTIEGLTKTTSPTLPSMEKSLEESNRLYQIADQALPTGVNENNERKSSPQPGDSTLLNSKPLSASNSASCRMHAGWLIPLVNVNALNSETNGELLAQVRENVYDSRDQRCLMIPFGSKILLTYNPTVRVGQERFQAAATQLILPNGHAISLAPTLAYDTDGEAGVKAHVNNHYFKIFSSSLLVGLIGKWAGDDVVVTQRNWGESRSEGSIFAKTLADTSSHLLDRNKVIAPSLTIPSGMRFNLMLSKSIELPPYLQD